MTTLQDFKDYMGDVNLEYGGTFYNLENWKYGYVDALRITDLDGACGFDGACLIERCTIIVDNSKRIKQALQSCDIGKDAFHKMDSHSRKLYIADSCLWYGLADCDKVKIVQTETDPDYAGMTFDGWSADIRLSDDQDLFDYILAQGYLSDFS